MNRRAKSCGKDGRKAPLEIPSGFPLSHSSNNNKLDDRDHFQQNSKTSVASLRGLIGPSRNTDRHQSGMLIDFIGIPTLTCTQLGGTMTLPENRVTDRRIQKTQNLLRDALVSLIHEKNYDAIVVKEILDRANVGRSTFYMHFRDKDELLVSGIHDMLRSIQPTVLPSSAKRYEKIVWFSLAIFEYHDQHRRSCDAKIGTR